MQRGSRESASRVRCSDAALAVTVGTPCYRRGAARGLVETATAHSRSEHILAHRCSLRRLRGSVCRTKWDAASMHLLSRTGRVRASSHCAAEHPVGKVP